MRWVAALVVLVLVGVAPPAAAAPQDDAGSGADAGDTFETATPLVPQGRYDGQLDREGGDLHDYYRFFLPEGSFVSVLVETRAPETDPITLLDPAGLVVDAGTRTRGLGLSASAVFTGEAAVVRLAVHRAHVAGEYRLHLQATEHELGSYSLCFMNCEGPVDAPIDLIFGGSLRKTRTRVLLIPPAHGDLGNPLGPTVLDYIAATLRGIHSWTRAMDAFAADYPQFDYLRRITVEVELFDGLRPVDPAGYDVVIGYVAAGPRFRGVAFGGPDGQHYVDSVGLGDFLRAGGRFIALSLFGASPRAGQVLYDFPEVNDLENVTAHEFGHTFGLGHTRTWRADVGPDLMNSPAAFVYGDGFAAGDGGERTPRKCHSSLDLYGMAVLYRWIPTGVWQPSGGSVSLPPSIPYRWYC